MIYSIDSGIVLKQLFLKWAEKVENVVFVVFEVEDLN